MIYQELKESLSTELNFDCQVVEQLTDGDFIEQFDIETFLHLGEDDEY